MYTSPGDKAGEGGAERVPLTLDEVWTGGNGGYIHIHMQSMPPGIPFPLEETVL